jgi:hypothetical protein
VIQSFLLGWLNHFTIVAWSFLRFYQPFLRFYLYDVMTQLFLIFLRFYQLFFWFLLVINRICSVILYHFVWNLSRPCRVSGTSLPLPALEYKTLPRRRRTKTIPRRILQADKKQSYALFFWDNGFWGLPCSRMLHFFETMAFETGQTKSSRMLPLFRQWFVVVSWTG